MSAAKEIQAAQALSTKAIQKEVNKEYDAAFELHIKAAEAFMHLAQTLSDTNAKATCKAAVKRALERAGQIKNVLGDVVRPVVADPHSPQEQAYILEKSSVVNGLRFPLWLETDARSDVAGGSGETFQDPDGQPTLASVHRGDEARWRSPAAVLPRPLRIADSTLLPDDLVQTVVTDCSVVAALSVCLAHQRRFGSKLGYSSLYPQDANGCPILSRTGQYTVRVFLNGSWRKIVIDGALPFLENGQLLGVSTGQKQVLWPALLEKAYMKLMGGYAFPGSNSGADLYTLIGWIPEHIHIRSPEFRMEGTWSRIFNGFKSGDCLVTLGTPNSNDNHKSQLLPAHNYAVFDMEDDGEERHILLHDPWRTAVSTPIKVTSQASSSVDSTFMRPTWRETCIRFDTIHLSWNPTLSSHCLHIHGTWKVTNNAVQSPSISNRTRLRIRRSGTQVSETWILLSRHIIDKHEEAKFISLNVNIHEEDGGAYLRDKPFVHGTYTNSVHTLRRFVSHGSDNIATVVASIEGAKADVRYTLTILSDAEVILEPRSQRVFYPKTVTGNLSTQSSGGNHTYPTFMNNPQYKLSIHPAASGEGSDPNARTPFILSAKGPKELPLNVKIVWSNGRRITELVEGDVIANTGPYSYGTAYCEGDLKAGDYTLIISAFEPRQIGSYVLCLQSLRPFDIALLEPEGAGMYTKPPIRGAWSQNTAAGSPAFGKYYNNPKLKLFIPSSMHVMVRMQLLQAAPSASINISIFVLETNGTIGPRVLSSGEYSDSIAGIIIPRSAISPGNYVLIPSTYKSGSELAFQILLYSTAGGIDVSWL